MSVFYGCFQRNSKALTQNCVSQSFTAGTAGSNREEASLFCKGTKLQPAIREKANYHAANSCFEKNYSSFKEINIVASVRLDNREDLANTLGISASEVQLHSNENLIIRAYKKWGFDCTKHLLGDFSFVLFDHNTDTLFSARDQIGIQSFYYHLTAERFIFSNDIQAILAHPEVSTQLNESYVAASLTKKGFYHNKYTFYQDILKLPPAHFIIIQTHQVRIAPYWFPENTPEIRYKSNDDYIEHARDLLQKSVECRIPNMGTVGTHLSGGLDSSAISVLTAQALKRQEKAPPATFCWQPLQDENNDLSTSYEHSLIQAICQQESLTPYYLTPTAKDFISNLKKDITIEPSETTLFAEAALQRQAKEKGIDVLLSGWGGDEGISFNGRGHYIELLFKGQWRRFFQESPGNPFKSIAAQLLTLLPIEMQRRIFFSKERGWKRREKMYIHPEFAQQIQPLASPSYTQIGAHHTQHQLLHYGHIQERIEAWAVSARRHQIEYRYPLLDRRILEFSYSIPPELFMQGEWRRWIMRKTIDGLVPHEVSWNKSKAEPARVESFSSIIPSALTQIGQSLLEQTTVSNRSEYIDMQRLIADLTHNFDPQRTRIGKIRPALHLLDW